MWQPVLGSLYRLASPKSIIYTLLQCRPMPIRKLSGLMSRWIKHLLCTSSIRASIWSASISTVFSVNRRQQNVNKSSKLGPSKSITRTQYDREGPYHLRQKNKNEPRDILCLGYSNGTSQYAIHFVFELKLRMSGVDILHFNSNLLKSLRIKRSFRTVRREPVTVHNF